MIKVYCFKVFSLACLMLICFMIKAEQATSIVLASSSALTGPTASLGIKLNRGAQLYFDQINQNGGIHGQPIALKMLDDGYEPFRTYQNTLKFLESDDLFALFNYVGTPTSHVIIPLLDKYQSLYLTPFTGADFLRTPLKPLIFNLRTSYLEEVEAQIDYLVNQAKVKNIALLVQADEFGDAVEAAYISVLKKYGLKPVVTTRFRRNTEDIELSLDVMKKYPVDAVAFVGTYKPFAHFINLAAARSFNPYFSAVSFVSSQDLFQRIKVPARIFVTEVLPDPATCDLSVCKEFRQESQQAQLDEVDRIVFEGYLNARLFVKVASKCGKKLSKTCFIEKMNHFSEDLGGLRVKLTETNHQGLDQVYYNFYDYTK